ncbi:MAG: hypothetical protein ABFD25_10115 [Clostridiaceae bacterium]
MKMKVTIGCAACGFSDTLNVNSAIDCSAIVCPKCGNEDCMSITSVSESADDNFKKPNVLKRLQMINQL